MLRKGRSARVRLVDRHFSPGPIVASARKASSRHQRVLRLLDGVTTTKLKPRQIWAAQFAGNLIDAFSRLIRRGRRRGATPLSRREQRI